MLANWITATPYADKMSLYVFKKTFKVEDHIKSFSVRISADTRYRFYLNGKELSQGPCKSSRYVKHYEEIECGDALINGENEIKVLVLHVPLQEDYRFTTASHKEKPALYFDGTLTTENGTAKIVSDESFSVFRAKHITYTYHSHCMPTIGPFEVIDGNESYEELKCSILYTPNIDSNGYDYWGVKEEYKLEARPVQILDINPTVEIKKVREYYDENGNYNIILDAGKYTTAMMKYEFLAPEGTEIKFIYTECPLTVSDDGSLYKGMRDNEDGVIQYGTMDNDHYDEVKASGGKQTFEPFWYRVYRFIRVECSKKPKCFSAFSARYTYNFEKDAISGGIGSFECSDEKYKKLWDVSRNTLECCTHETYADCPYYEQQQYVGDARFEAVYAWKLSNDSKMQKKVIIDTVHSLQPDGLVATTSPNMWVQILHISTFYFINLIREYLRFTGDVKFVKTLTGTIASGIEYFEGVKTPEGLINPPDGCRFIDWSSSWKNGFPEGGDKSPMAVYNLMYASMLKDAIEICDGCGYIGLASDYKSMHKELIEAVNKHFFDKEVGLYTDIPGKKSFSEHAGVWAVLSNAITGNDAKEMVEKMMESDFVIKSSFSKNYDLLRVLDKVGLYDKYAPKILNQWDEMLDKHCTTWCESTSFPRSECHGWSCIPMYEMSAQILGVKALDNGFKKVQIKPYTLGLSYAKGRVPTPYGYIDVSWIDKNGKFTLEVNSSESVEMEITLPDGKSETVHTKQYIIK